MGAAWRSGGITRKYRDPREERRDAPLGWGVEDHCKSSTGRLGYGGAISINEAGREGRTARDNKARSEKGRRLLARGAGEAAMSGDSPAEEAGTADEG